MSAPNIFLKMTTCGWLCVSLLSLFVGFANCQTGARRNCTIPPKEEKCSLRYDLVVSKQNEGYVKKNCSYWFSYHFCICDANLKIEYFETPPYVFTVNGTVNGILPAMLRLLLNHCCGGCTRLIFAKKPLKSMQTAMAMVYNTSVYDIMMPFIGVSGVHTSFGFPFQGLLDTPGVSYVEIDETSERVLENLVNAVRDTWPLFVIMVILTIQGGVVVWLLDTNKNPEEFPPAFVKGTLEGSWWAFVSMTTVGYGDKSPKSHLGRLFGVFWISVGIAISGIFTATLSSAMTSAVIAEPTKLRGKLIGTPAAESTRYEENIVYREGGTPKPYKNASDMINDLKAEKIHGVLIDRFVLRHHIKIINAKGVKLEVKKDLKNSDTVIGFIFSNKALAKWTTFLDEFFVENKDAENRLVADALKSMSHKMPDPLPEVIKSDSPFSSPRVYKTLIQILSISGACILAIGFIVHMGKKLYFKKLQRKVIAEVIEMEKQKAWQNGEMERNIDLLQERIEKTLLESLSMEMAQLREEIKIADK